MNWKLGANVTEFNSRAPGRVPKLFLPRSRTGPARQARLHRLLRPIQAKLVKHLFEFDSLARMWWLAFRWQYARHAAGNGPHQDGLTGTHLLPFLLLFIYS